MFGIAFEKWKNRSSKDGMHKNIFVQEVIVCCYLNLAVIDLFNFLAGTTLENGSIVPSRSKFDSKIEATSAKMYFHYYGQLLHQQNMLQDFVRTGQFEMCNIYIRLLSKSCSNILFSLLTFPGTYYAAVIENKSDFEGRVVVDVGAGSGILSLFAAQVDSYFHKC